MVFIRSKSRFLLAASFAVILSACGAPANAKPVAPDQHSQTVVVSTAQKRAYSTGNQTLDQFRFGPQTRLAGLTARRAGETTHRRQFHPTSPSSEDTITIRRQRRGVFGSVAIPFGKLPTANRWKAVYASLGIDEITGCQSAFCSARQTTLAEAVSRSRRQAFAEKLRTVNSAVNASIAYVVDTQNYGQVDHWAEPAETIGKGSGDCEDFAILKMALLKAVGIPTRSMSLVVLRDRKRNLFHAVLSVATDQGYFILDNAHDAVLSDTSVPRYQPLFSMSENRSWIHGIKRKAGDLVASNLSFETIAPGEGAESLGRIDPGQGRLK